MKNKYGKKHPHFSMGIGFLRLRFDKKSKIIIYQHISEHNSFSAKSHQL